MILDQTNNIPLNKMNSRGNDPNSEILYLKKVLYQKEKNEKEIQERNNFLEEKESYWKSELESVNKDFESFIYSVSHDLIAPLRAIEGFSKIILKEVLPQPEFPLQEHLKRVIESSRQMKQMIEDLTSYSRIGRKSIVLQTVETEQIINVVLTLLNKDQNGRNVKIKIGKLPQCIADFALLKQLFFQLVSNAFKFTTKRKNAKIEIGCTLVMGAFVWYVKDNGIGFDMRYAREIFNIFFRLQHPIGYEGRGIGLAVAKRIVLLHGGRIWVESEIGVGSTFYFTIEKRYPK